jgi:7-alpha-hydroxysteroid dehydrogenase
MQNFRLDQKVAVITGASKGLGKAMALALAKAGARLALVSRDAPLLEKVAAEARTHQRGTGDAVGNTTCGGLRQNSNPDQ